jgi:hypothetical protein
MWRTAGLGALGGIYEVLRQIHFPFSPQCAVGMLLGSSWSTSLFDCLKSRVKKIVGIIATLSGLRN